MKPSHFSFRSSFPFSAGTVFDWHLRPGAFERLAPPWSPPRIAARGGTVATNGWVELRIPVGPFSVGWRAQHSGFVPGEQFIDIQEKGPFAYWRHVHTVKPSTDNSSELEDRIEFALPGKPLTEPLHEGMKRTLQTLFAYRHRTTLLDLQELAKARRPLKVLVSGSTGLIGSALMSFLSVGGHEPIRLLRPKSHCPPGDPYPSHIWDKTRNSDEALRELLSTVDAVVHLGGTSITNRWKGKSGRKIYSSRIQSTERLSRLLAETHRGDSETPRTLVCASAIGYYGDHGDEVIDESTPASPVGESFLSDICRDWEGACEPARQAGIRVVNMRIGMVLSPQGGALASMLPPFKMGLGGSLGSGTQYWSWISLDDMVGAIHHALVTETLHGPVNAVAPEAIQNQEFSSALARVLRRPSLVTVPASAARFLLGKMADELMLASRRIVPSALLASGYTFRDPKLEDALRIMLGRSTLDLNGPRADGSHALDSSERERPVIGVV